MGRLRPWHNLPPVLQCSKYRRLLENTAGTGSSNLSTDNLSDTSDEADWNGIGDDSASDRKEKNAKRKGNKSGGKRNRKKDCTRQLIQESFQELMSYSCGQCGHVQTLQAEELKSILGHAFRLAYAAHLQKAAGLHDFPGGGGSSSPPPPSPPPPNHLTTAGGGFRHHRLGGGSPSLHSLQSTLGSSLSTTPHLPHNTSSTTNSHHLHHLHTTSSTTAPSSLKHHAGYSSTTSNNNNNTQNTATNSSSSSSSKGLALGRLHTHTDQRPCDQSCMVNSESCSSSSGVSSIQGGVRHTGKMRTPARLPGLQSDHSATRSHLDNPHSPDSDTSNSPTDHNSSHRLLDKPPLLKQFSVPPLEDAPPIPTSSSSSPTHHLVDPLFPSSSANNINNNNLSPSGSSSSTNNLNCGGSQSNSSCGGVCLGLINDGSKDSAKGGHSGTECCASSSVLVHNIALGEQDSSTATHHLLESSSTHSNSPIHSQSSFHSNHSHSPLHSHSHSPTIHVTHSQSPLHSIHSSSPLHSSHSQSPLHSIHSHSPLHTTCNSHHHPHSQSPLHSTHSQSPLHSAQSSVLSSQGSSHCPSPPPLPERSDSLAAPDEPHLRAAAWFQAGIPREIALEVLGQEPLGAFLVRESSSKPGCYALSLRVPADFAAGGIAHYLIVRTNRGYRIKGFTKEFPTLRTLITHHSVMPELLPVPLLLTRHNPAYSSANDTHDCNEDDPDYNTLSDFRKMMADLNVWEQAADVPPRHWGTGGRCVPLVPRVWLTVAGIKYEV